MDKKCTIEVTQDKEESTKECTETEIQNVNQNSNDSGDVRWNVASFIKEIKEAAEETQISNGFIYEETSGMYYDTNTGYYYDAELGFYYDGYSGKYMKFNETTNEFECLDQEFVEQSRRKKMQKDSDEVGISYDSNDSVEEISGQTSNNLIYEKTSGLYYDTTTGYYYNAENGLYYDGNNGRYLKFNDITRQYETYTEKNKNSSSSKDKDSHDNVADDEKEDGEISSSDEAEEDDTCKKCDDKYYEDAADLYPPCLRLIVQQTNLKELKIGSLFIVTYTGGTLGSKGETHDVLIPDKIVSKFHLRFVFNEKQKLYQCIDLGSRNGTKLNGKRLSSALQESEPFNIEHGSIIQISETKLLCHMHQGIRTCDDCEPGVVMKKHQKNTEIVPIAINYENEMKKLKAKYGLSFQKSVDFEKSGKYLDRGALRRSVVGSSHQCQKTEIASKEVEISKSNKGYQMLEKLKWQKGSALGKDESGIKQPIELISNKDKKGLGYGFNGNIEINGKKHKLKKWEKIRERYKNLPDTFTAIDVDVQSNQYEDDNNKIESICNKDDGGGTTLKHDNSETEIPTPENCDYEINHQVVTKSCLTNDQEIEVMSTDITTSQLKCSDKYAKFGWVKGGLLFKNE